MSGLSPDEIIDLVEQKPEPRIEEPQTETIKTSTENEKSTKLPSEENVSESSEEEDTEEEKKEKQQYDERLNNIERQLEQHKEIINNQGHGLIELKNKNKPKHEKSAKSFVKNNSKRLLTLALIMVILLTLVVCLYLLRRNKKDVLDDNVEVVDENPKL